MFRYFTVCLILVFSSSYGGEVALPTAKLGWRNGDVLEGHIFPSNGQRLTWKSDAFTGPFRLDLTQLKRIDFPVNYIDEVKSDSDVGPFRISFLNGDRLIGELVGMTSESVIFKSSRLSKSIVVNRRFIDRIERISAKQLRYSGPVEIDDWKETGRAGKKSDYWYARKNGEFATRFWGGQLFREISMPQKVEVSFSIVCPAERPNIELCFTEASRVGPKIETWDDTLVLTSGNQFTPILVMTEETRHLDLRVFWDQTSKIIKVCSANGEGLAKLGKVSFSAAQKKSSKSSTLSRRLKAPKAPKRVGFRLMNLTTGVRFSRLAVRNWDGQTIAKYDAQKPRIEMAGGDVLFDLNALELKQDSGLSLKGKPLTLDKIDQLVFSTAERQAANTSMSRLSWYDGGVITGAFSEIDHQTTTVKPVWLEEGIDADLRGAKRLYFPESKEPVLEPSDQIKSGSLELGGSLTLGNQGEANALLSWRPIGSENASPLNDDRKAEVTREAYPGATDIVGDARIYLTNDEVVAGKLISIDDGWVEFSSYLTGSVRIPYDKVRAVDIEGAGLIPNGFVDKGWEALPPKDGDAIDETLELFEKDKEKTDKPENVVITDDSVVLRKGGFGHMNLLVGDKIKFHTKWEANYGVFTLRLFCSDFTRDSPSTDLLIGAQGSKILVGTAKPGGGFNFKGQQIGIKDQEADIEVTARHDKIEVWVNGKLSLTEEVKPDRISGNGIVIQTGGGWSGWNDNPNNVVFTNFSVDRSPGFLPKRIINQQAKRNALLIPRFHRDNPPSHVLVASNGDLLRGQLKSALGDQISFRSRDVDMELAKTRVAAIIWLLNTPEALVSEAKPDVDPEVPVVKKPFLVTHQFVLHDGTRLNLAKENLAAEEEIFVGKSEILGLCKVPIQSIRNVKQGPAHPLGRTSSSDQLAYSDWILKNTPDPAIPKGDGSEASPMIGKVAPDFKLPLLSGGEFKLSNRKGRVVVLDFWATWCGPCIRAMPEVFRALGAFKGQPVDFCAVNQAETSPIINEFLENRGWTGTTVGLDFQLNAGRDYQVKGIPHTVVIGKDGKIAWVHTGYAPDLDQKLMQAISKALRKK